MIKKLIYTIILFIACLDVSVATALDLMLPQVYEENININGWLVSEKYDGARGYWNGVKMLSKNGHTLHPPAEFLSNFPSFALEGEIWGGRGTFEQTIAAVKKKKPHKGWLQLQFAIFDVPEAKGGFLHRIKIAREWFAKNHSTYAFVIEQTPLRNKEELQAELLRVERLGGEGLIVRKPDALYGKGRSGDILKVKSFADTEAVVIAYLPGKGRNKGRLGALLVELPSGIQFKIGTGFTDVERQQPPPVGSTITFKYYGLYQSGIPKFPSFLRVRGDKDI